MGRGREGGCSQRMAVAKDETHFSFHGLRSSAQIPRTHAMCS